MKYNKWKVAAVVIIVMLLLFDMSLHVTVNGHGAELTVSVTCPWIK